MSNLLFKRIDYYLKDKEFICGDNFTIADITGYFIFVTLKRLKFDIPKEFKNVQKWKLNLLDRECFNNE